MKKKMIWSIVAFFTALMLGIGITAYNHQQKVDETVSRLEQHKDMLKADRVNSEEDIKAIDKEITKHQEHLDSVKQRNDNLQKDIDAKKAEIDRLIQEKESY